MAASSDRSATCQPSTRRSTQDAVYVSDLFYGAVAKRYVVNVALPVVLETGRADRAGDDPERRQPRHPAPPAQAGAGLDRLRSSTAAASVIASTGEEEIGKPASLPLGRAAPRRHHDDAGDLHRPLGRDGARPPQLVGIGLAGGSIGAGCGHRGAAVELASTSCSRPASLCCCLRACSPLLFARVVSRPMLRLAGQARALGRGEVLTPLDSPVREVNEVSQSLAAAAAERKRSEDQVRFLMRELSHRAKNQLAVVVAMARRTAERSEGIADFEKVFSERLMALARSTDLLVNQNWRGVALAELVEAHLMPFAASNKSRLTVEGPHVELGPDAAQSLGLAFHELATNASKYGALSVPERQALRSVGAMSTVEPRALRLEWTESERSAGRAADAKRLRQRRDPEDRRAVAEWRGDARIPPGRRLLGDHSAARCGRPESDTRTPGLRRRRARIPTLGRDRHRYAKSAERAGVEADVAAVAPRHVAGDRKTRGRCRSRRCCGPGRRDRTA